MSGLKGIEISDVLGLSQPITKLIETVSGGIGKLYEPVHIKKIAKAKAEEIKLISDAMEECSVIPTQYNDGNLLLNNTDWNEFVKRTQGRLAFQELQKQNNIECVISQAYNILENAEFCSREPVEQGWITRFFDSVADISNEDLQELWGKLLAGEIKKPGSFSLRTLDIIRNISQLEARTFEKIMPYFVHGNNEIFITSRTELLDKYGIRYSDIMLLDECGLINSSGTLSLNITLSKKDSVYLFNSSRVSIIKGISEIPQQISFGVYTLTKAGKELYQILASDTNDDVVISDLAEEIVNRNSKKTSITIHKMNYFNSQSINYNENVLNHYGVDLVTSDDTSKNVSNEDDND